MKYGKLCFVDLAGMLLSTPVIISLNIGGTVHGNLVRIHLCDRDYCGAIPHFRDILPKEKMIPLL
jgi:hypothetical protein